MKTTIAHFVKLVPENDPNADGFWFELPAGVPVGGTFNEAVSCAAPHVPPGFFICAVRSAPVETFYWGC